MWKSISLGCFGVSCQVLEIEILYFLDTKGINIDISQRPKCYIIYQYLYWPKILKNPTEMSLFRGHEPVEGRCAFTETFYYSQHTSIYLLISSLIPSKLFNGGFSFHFSYCSYLLHCLFLCFSRCFVYFRLEKHFVTVQKAAT